MNKNKKYIIKILLMINAWETVAPEATIGGMTLAQFKAAVKPALDSYERLTALDKELKGERQTLTTKSRGGFLVATQLASLVKGDANFGDDSPLYAAMGYISRSRRKSGLTRKNAAAVTPAAAQNAESVKS